MLTPDDITPAAKACTQCGEVKPLDGFNRASGALDGRRSNCRECTLAASRASYAANPERWSAYFAAYRAAHPERGRAAAKRWYDKNPERARAAASAWAKANPERVQQKIEIRRARKLNAPVVEAIERDVVWDRDGGRCHICKRKCDPAAWHLDHLIPLSRGGEHSYRNVAVSHPLCNMRKHTNGPAQLRLTG